MGSVRVRVHLAGNFLAFLLAVLAVSLEHARGQALETGNYDPTRAARAMELLGQARAAAGGEKELQGVTSVSASIRLRRLIRYISVVSPKKVVQKEKTLTGSISIELQLPDKFRKRVTTFTLLGNKYSYVAVVNGERGWREPPLLAASSNRDPRLIDVSDFEKSLANQARSTREQLSFYAFAWLIRMLPDDSLRFNFAGWMKTESGNADVLTAYDLANNRALLLLDQKTHLPNGFDSIYSTVRMVPVVVEGVVVTRNEFIRMMEKAREERRAQLKPAQRTLFQTRLSDYRRVADILLPHRVTTLIEGKLYEEMEITKIEISRRLNPKDFEPKRKNKKGQ
jgi:hypothetical protein